MHGRSGKEQHRGFNCSGEVAGWIRAQSEARLAAIDASEECDPRLPILVHHAGVRFAGADPCRVRTPACLHP